MNKNMALLFAVLHIFSGCACFSGCVNDADAENSRSAAENAARTAASAQLKIVNWNVQTFFDAQTDGTEYSDFKKSSAGWGRDAYIKRLDRLCEVINSLDADIFVMEEIENAGILYDISNRLAGNSWRKDKIYDYGCFAKDSGSAIGCAVLSKHLIANLKVHSLDIRTESCAQPSMRLLMEVTIFAGGRPFVLYVNHWKSMSGGEAETEIWRCWQESVLGAKTALRTTSKNTAVIACGDFNRDIAKFSTCSKNEASLSDSADVPNIFFRYITSNISGGGTAARIGLYSPWILSDGASTEQGSYYYNDEWNHIDHFFSAGKASIRSFSVETNGPWAGGDGIPDGYKIYTGGGYSDHLPVSCIVNF